jgi:ABC-type nitrate/sulfonate/bicarbonate transport system ATPase subunit
VYHDADIVLLDSPLAAVDSHVSAHLVEKCILGQGALGNKTRILVTHHLEVLPDLGHGRRAYSSTRNIQGAPE